MKSKRMLTAALSLALLLPFSACSGGAQGTAGPSVSGAADVTETVTETVSNRANTPDSLPATLDFKGEKLSVMVRESDQYLRELIADELTGELVNDAIHARNRTVEERLNVKFTYRKVGASYRNADETLKLVTGSVLAGENAYDIFANAQYNVVRLAVDGYLCNVYDMPYIELERPWWNQNFVSEVTVNDKLYMLDGEISLNTLDYVWCMYFNQNLMSKYYPSEKPYQTVLDGGWTVDKLSELVKGVYSDVNGDGKRDAGDVYGLNSTASDGERAGYRFGFGLKYTTRGADGLPKLNTFDERIAKVYDVMYRLINENSGVFVPESEDASVKMFAENGALFHMDYVRRAVFDFREMESGYGILPMPKLNAAQERYYTGSQNSHTQYAVLSDCKNTDKVGAALELMCAENYRTVTEMYYETAMKGKYLRDEESGKMLELIMDGIMIDFGYQYAIKTGELYVGLPGRDQDIASAFEAQYAKVKAEFDVQLGALLK